MSYATVQCTMYCKVHLTDLSTQSIGQALYYTVHVRLKEQCDCILCQSNDGSGYCIGQQISPQAVKILPTRSSLFDPPASKRTGLFNTPS